MAEKKYNEEEIIDVPIVEVPIEEEQSEDILNLEDIAYAVMVGRTKDGQIFNRTINTNDLVLIRGLLEFSLDEVKYEIEKYFNNVKTEGF